MAENSVDATLEENNQLREQIEAIQRKRRRNFADADRIHEETLVRKENQRLKNVLESQQGLLASSDKAKEDAGKDDSDESSRASQVPYTITREGPIYSTKSGSAKAEEPEEAPRTPPQVPRSTYGLSAAKSKADGDDNENEEN